jgi:hypothetical protein
MGRKTPESRSTDRDTFFPTPIFPSVRLICAMALKLGLKARYQDVKTSFLKPSLPEDERVDMAPHLGMEMEAG